MYDNFTLISWKPFILNHYSLKLIIGLLANSLILAILSTLHCIVHCTLYNVHCALCSTVYCIIPQSLFLMMSGRPNQRESILRRGALACTVPPVWLELPDKFLIGNLSYIPSSEPSRTGLLLDVMYTMYARHPP